eukprot:TRINITY_DN13503_c0_g1_i3.p1 TRINITY_DN13503_c0_g1~~TRINITY_DN13503_c0_g1_i3.p1  ORF type:complete len:152 (+),score=48.60 TRINITY_DN13503_c0_g1_i3:120-575(+)
MSKSIFYPPKDKYEQVEPLDEETSAAIFGKLDKDNDGYITTGEFLKALTGRHKDEYRPLFQAVGVSWKEVFRGFDRDQNGAITLSEFTGIMMKQEEVKKGPLVCKGWSPTDEAPDNCGETLAKAWSDKGHRTCPACFEKAVDWRKTATEQM